MSNSLTLKMAVALACGAMLGAPGFRVYSTGSVESASQEQYKSAKAEYIEWTLEPGEPGLAIQAGALVFEVYIEETAPASVQSLVWLTDREGRRFQSFQEAPLSPGRTNRVTVAMDAEAPNWRPVGHAAAWQHLTRKGPKEIGLRFFSREPWEGRCVLLSAAVEKTPRENSPPKITGLQAPKEARVRELYEVKFNLPDRYLDPFNPAEIDVSAVFTAPDGTETKVDGFYYQDYFRIPGAVYDRVTPQGRGGWRVRFAPTQPGEWRAELRAVEAHTLVSAPESWRFTAVDTDAPRFIRVAKSDPRYFETTDGEFFYPIGHNIRSPFDTRMDDQFPFRLRHNEGTTAYRRYFKDMAAAGQNLAEVWMCAWSLGIEWSPVIPGYFGAGDYNLANAWEMDEVMRWARESGLYINLVLNNHGRVGEWCDPEWNDHPYNRRQGGWLDRANEFFSDPRAREMQKRLYRYTVARWGWDPMVFAWELMSELDLVGNDYHSYHNPEMVEWHRVMANIIRGYDAGRHMVTTHFSTDYTKLPDSYGFLAELDFHGLDTYHNGQPENVVNLILASCRATEKFNKPVVINEFGGSPMATSIHDLRRELHASIWAGAASTMAGTPLLWWWHVVDEYDLYPKYTHIRDFMRGVDKRDPLLKTARAIVEMPARNLSPQAQDRPPQPRVEAVCIASPTHAIGWLWAREAYTRDSWEGRQFDVEGIKVTLNGFTNPVCRVSYWDTQTGKEIKRERLRPIGGRLEFFPPPFSRDTAFKITPATSE